jgi:hypothetical protein
MPEINGFKTLDLVIQEVGASERKVREAIEALKIEPTTFKIDRRVKYYSPEDVKHIKDWLLSN